MDFPGFMVIITYYKYKPKNITEETTGMGI